MGATAKTPRRLLFLFLPAFLLALATAGFAQDPRGQGRYELPFTRVIPFPAEANGIDYALYVRTPRDFDRSNRRYPVMVLLDADYQFALATNIVEHLADRRNQAEEMVIVAIACPGVYPDRDAYRRHRSRDYTPTHTLEGGYGPELQRQSGGGPKFQRFIAEELLPWLEEHFRTDPQRRIFVGHSYGGLFGAWMLLEHPATFTDYLLVSPSLWYHQKRYLDPRRIAAMPALEEATRVFLAVGDHENQGASGGWAMVDDLATFHRLLAEHGDPKLEVEHRVFEDETHASIFPAAFSTGIRHLLRD